MIYANDEHIQAHKDTQNLLNYLFQMFYIITPLNQIRYLIF